MLAVALLGCTGRPYPPDEQCRSGPWVYHRETSCGALTAPLVCPWIDRTLSASLEVCPASKRDDLRSDFASLRVDIYGFPVKCGGHPAYGCQDGDAISLDDANDELASVAADETAHVTWERCFGRTGEHTNPDGSREYDEDFEAFLQSVYAEGRP